MVTNVPCGVEFDSEAVLCGAGVVIRILYNFSSVLP